MLRLRIVELGLNLRGGGPALKTLELEPMKLEQDLDLRVPRN